MADFDFIKQSLASSLPLSIERVAEMIKKSLQFYSELKNQFLSVLPQEKNQAIQMAQLIFAHLDEEIKKVCQKNGWDALSFNQLILSYLMPSDREQYLEAMAFIQANQQELFRRIEVKRTVNSKAALLQKAPRVRC